MLNQNIAITRGEGAEDIEFDFTADSPARDIVEDDIIKFRIEDKVSPLLLKLNDNAKGDDTQVEYDADLDTVTVHLTQEEKNTQPDSGRIYKLYINDELAAYGNITASGTAPSEEETASSTQYVNGDNFIQQDANFNVRDTDDYINVVTATPDTVEATLFAGSTSKSNSKRVWFRHVGDGTLAILSADGLTTLKTITTNGWYLAVCKDLVWYV